MNKYRYIFGTANFPSKEAAFRYYNATSGGEYSKDDILEKIKNYEIAIGRPMPRADEDAWLNNSEERYYIGVK